jgi:hypothetical protein
MPANESRQTPEELARLASGVFKRQVRTMLRYEDDGKFVPLDVRTRGIRDQRRRHRPDNRLGFHRLAGAVSHDGGPGHMPFPVEVAFIQEAERQLGRKLPVDLRVRLHRENGGGIRAAGDEWQLFPVYDSSDRKRITRTANHIIRQTRWARGCAGFPEDSVAIAENGGGDYLIVRADSDLVEFWDHETGESEPVNVAW